MQQITKLSFSISILLDMINTVKYGIYATAIKLLNYVRIDKFSMNIY